jgi:hypothetical protein
MSKAKAKTTIVAPLPSALEADLIRNCMEYAQAVAATTAAFAVDPDGNNIYAERVADRCGRRAGKALANISGTQAATVAGIAAKARVVEFLLRENDIQPECAAFFASFASDVREQTRKTVEADFSAAQKAVQS